MWPTEACSTRCRQFSACQGWDTRPSLSNPHTNQQRNPTMTNTTLRPFSGVPYIIENNPDYVESDFDE